MANRLKALLVVAILLMAQGCSTIQEAADGFDKAMQRIFK